MTLPRACPSMRNLNFQECLRKSIIYGIIYLVDRIGLQNGLSLVDTKSSTGQQLPTITIISNINMIYEHVTTLTALNCREVAIWINWKTAGEAWSFSSFVDDAAMWWFYRTSNWQHNSKNVKRVSFMGIHANRHACEEKATKTHLIRLLILKTVSKNVRGVGGDISVADKSSYCKTFQSYVKINYRQAC